MANEYINTADYVCVGSEMRRGVRRIRGDRRDMLRYEPDKDNRRSGIERRSASSTWDKRNSID